MTSLDLRKRKIDLSYKLAFYVVGLGVATILATIGSEHAGEAFALVGGIIGGDALSGK